MTPAGTNTETERAGEEGADRQDTCTATDIDRNKYRERDRVEANKQDRSPPHPRHPRTPHPSSQRQYVPFLIIIRKRKRKTVEQHSDPPGLSQAARLPPLVRIIGCPRFLFPMRI